MAKFIKTENGYEDVATSVNGSNKKIVSSELLYKALGNRSVLTFDNNPTSGSSNLMNSARIYYALGNRSRITTDAKPYSGSYNLLTSGGIYTALGNRDKLTFDTTPTSGSTKLMTSGNIYTALQKLENSISLIPKFSISVVTELPTTDISETTVYLVKESETDNNLYTEYIYVNDGWETLGAQNIDLSDYAKTSDIPLAEDLVGDVIAAVPAEIPLVTRLPNNANVGDLCIYARANSLTGPTDANATLYISREWLDNPDWEFPDSGSINATFDIATDKTFKIAISPYQDPYQGYELLEVQIYIKNVEEWDEWISYFESENGQYVQSENPNYPGSHTYYRVETGVKKSTPGFPASIQAPSWLAETTASDTLDIPFPFFYHEPKLMIYLDEWVELLSVESIERLEESSHTHTNAEILESFSEDADGELLYKGDYVSPQVAIYWKDEKLYADGTRLATEGTVNKVSNRVDVLEADQHTHANAETLNKFSEGTDGGLLYNGEEIGGSSQVITPFQCLPETANEGDVYYAVAYNALSVPDDSNCGVILYFEDIPAMGLPDGYDRRYWTFEAPNSTGRGFQLWIDIQRIQTDTENYVLTCLNLVSETTAGKWYWKDGKFTTDIPDGSSRNDLPRVIPLGRVDDFIYSKKIYNTAELKVDEDTDETVVFSSYPTRYMFVRGDWLLIEQNDDATWRAITELKADVEELRGDVDEALNIVSETNAMIDESGVLE